MEQSEFEQYLKSELSRRGYSFREETSAEIDVGASIGDLVYPRPVQIRKRLPWLLYVQTDYQGLRDSCTGLITSQIGNLRLFYVEFEDGVLISVDKKGEDILSINPTERKGLQRWIDLARGRHDYYIKGLEYLNEVLQNSQTTQKQLVREILDFAENHHHL